MAHRSPLRVIGRHVVKKWREIKDCLNPMVIVTDRTEDAAALRGLLSSRASPQLTAFWRIQGQALHPKVQLLTSRRVWRYNSHVA